MKTIWKYQLTNPYQNDFDIPTLNKFAEQEPLDFSHQVLKLDVQHYVPTFWVAVDTSEQKQKIRIHTVGTGWDASQVNVDQYIGTIQDPNGLVWHFFYEIL